MRKDSLQSLSNKRIAHAKSLKENGDHSHQIIGEELYSEPIHFIFELLQNAEDENAKTITISYDDKALVLEHNGRAFNINDIEAITSFGNNTRKKQKPNAIGRFGIGFKSVFSITDKPEIKSGPYHFSIVNYIIPSVHKSEFHKKTTITLPFKKVAVGEIYSMLLDALDEINPNCLLFLNNVRSLEIKNLKNKVYKKIEVKRFARANATFKILHISNASSEPAQYILFEKNVTIDNKRLPIKLAFNINKRGQKISFIPAAESPLFAFFATEVETNLPFYIHAPFLTTPARDNIKSKESRNDTLILELTDLMVKAIDELKIHGLINLQTWLAFPCNVTLMKYDIYKVFANGFLNYLGKKNSAILPTDGGGYCHVLKAMRLRRAEIKTMITFKDAVLLFNRNEWISQDFNHKDYSSLYEFIKTNFNVPRIGYQELCEKADNSFFAKKNDAWLLDFYKSIVDEQALWRTGTKTQIAGPLRSKAFIRNSKNKMVCPFSVDDKPLIYLPTSGSSNYMFVKDFFTEDKDLKRLFRQLNINKPDLIAEVNEHILPRLDKESTVYKGYREDLFKVFRALRRVEYSEEADMIYKLSKISWLPGKSNLSKNLSLKRPDALYYPTRDLKSFVKESTSAYFLDLNTLSEHHTRVEDKNLFKRLGVFFHPKRFYRQTDRLVFENSKVTGDWNNKNIHLEGLATQLKKNLDKKASVKLWSYLASMIEDWKSTGFANTGYIEVLKSHKWVFDKYGIRHRPAEIIFSDLDDIYEYAPLLREVLNFKPDEIGLLETSYNAKFIPNELYKEIMDRLKAQEQEIERLKNKYEGIVSISDDDSALPDINEVMLGEALLDADIMPLSDDLPIGHQVTKPTGINWMSTEPIYVNTAPTHRQQHIGKRGEDLVINKLKAFYAKDRNIEVVDLNDLDKLGAGCDILIKKKGIAILRIEVKSTEGGFDNTFKLSQMQIKTALDAHFNNDTPSFHLYCVYWAGSSKPELMIIDNPISYFLDKKLRATELWFSVKRKKMHN
jgi:hypothetical protein